MFYVSGARGFKGPTITALGALGAVKSEIDKSYEIGTKADWLQHRLSSSFTVFRADVTNLQSQGVDSIDTPRGPISSIFLTNAAKARSKGVEFEVTAVPTEQLSLNLGFAYTDAKFVSYPEAACFGGQTLEQGCTGGDLGRQNLSGKRMPLVPKLSGNAAATYDFTLPFLNGKHYVRLDYTYRDRINWDLGLAPLTESDAVGIWGVALGLRSEDERMEFLAAVKNLTDEYVVNDLSGGSGTIQADLLPEYQRTFEVSLSYKFR
jgi:iron complex outermembrane receptor protein